MTKKQKNLLIRVIISGALMAILCLLPLKDKPLLSLSLFLIPYLTVGHDILRKAWKGIRNRQVFDEHFLMAIATIGAMALGEYTEAVAVMWFYQVGELFQSYAVGKSRQNIAELMDIRPDYANIEDEDGNIERVDPDDVEVGTIIVIKPGEKIPIDGIVREGSSTLNTAALTGESVPRDAAIGDEVISGCINMSGLIKVETTKEFDESTASKILDLVENASSRKSKSEQFITKFARVYTPAVCYSALALAFLPPIIRFLIGLDPLWLDWIYRALTFLVISCPCAIVVSIPLSFFGGIGGASNQGILIKGSNYMETLASVKTVAFDKTGTITKGNFEVSDIHHSPLADSELLEIAALAESRSTHPISKSLSTAHGKKLDMSRVTDVKEISGEGILSVVDDHDVAAGNLKLMSRIGISANDCHSAGTIVHMAIDGEYVGHIVIADELKENSKEAIAEMKKSGVKRTVMLTGDKEKVANKIAAETGIDEYYAELLPADKVSHVERLLAECGEKEKLAFVGDGINDAPVLSRADIGIAMGALGSDAAIEAADVVLMDDDPLKIPKAIKIAKKCIRIVYENIYFAIIVKLACLILGALGIASMWLAIFADVGVMVICVLNAIRCLAVKNL
ncbi:MAG: heavy metal translocating P-type ATPase [Lachnospiraceae bacterium]|nr:heavy metal translocating P-type ATPase [Lachnospiraceae bacterium]